MKTKITTLTLFLLFALGISNVLTAQETHVITLRVDTSRITKETVNQYSNFGQDSSISNENFTVYVNVGDTVEWEGISTSSQDDEVEIMSIKHERGPQLFNRGTLNGSGGIVRAAVASGRRGDSEKYTIKFRIVRNGIRINTIFKIDPKIVIKQ